VIDPEQALVAVIRPEMNHAAQESSAGPCAVGTPDDTIRREEGAVYCQYCEQEQSLDARFCQVCSARLIDRSEKAILADHARQRFLVDSVERWKASGKLAPELAEELSAPHRRQVELLNQALASLGGEAASVEPKPDPALPEVEPPTVEASAPALVDAPVPASLGAAAVPAPAPAAAAAPAVAVQPTEPEPSIESISSSMSSVPAAEPARPEPMVSAREEVAETDRILKRESTWPTLLKPLLGLNMLWFIAATALVAGSFYFVSLSHGSARSLLVAGLVGAYATGFGWLGRYFARRDNTVPGRILASISGAMAPMSLLALQSLKNESIVLWAGSSAVFLVAMVLLVRGCAGVFRYRPAPEAAPTQPENREHFTLFAALLMGLFAAVPLFKEPIALRLLDGIALVALWLYAPAIGQAREDKGLAAFLGVGIGWLALCLFSFVHYQGIDAGFDWTHYAPLTALLVAVAMRADRALFPRRTSPSWLSLLLLVCLIPAVIGAGIAEWPEYHRPGPSLGLTAAISTLLLIWSARSWQSRSFTVIAVFVGWVSFYTLTGLFKLEWLLAIAGGVKHLTGYGASQKLPFNYGGLASLIYLAGVVVAYHRARKNQASWAIGGLKWSALILGSALVLWSHFDKGGFAADVKPAIFTCTIGFVFSLALSHWLVHWRLTYAAAIALTILGVDIGLLIGRAGVPIACGLAGAVLCGLGLALFLSSERAQALRNIAVISLGLACLVLPSGGFGTGAAIAWGLVALAGLGSAFSLGSGIFSALGFAALTAAVLFGADAARVPSRHLGWIAFGLVFAYLAASGLEKRQAETVAGGNWFGIRLPLAAAGYDIVRGPMAFAGMIVSWLGLILVCSGNIELFWSGFALFSLAQLYLARRQVSVTFLTLALLTAPVALAGCLWRLEYPRLANHAAATYAVCCSLLAIAVDRSGALQRFLRIPQRRAGITFCVHASLFAIAASISAMYVLFDERRGYYPELTLATAALAFYLLPRWNRWPGWLYPAALFATTAVAILVSAGWIPLVISCFALVSLGFVLLGQRMPETSSLVLGPTEPLLGRTLTVLGHLQAGAAIVAGLGVEAITVTPRWMMAPAAAALAIFYALAPRLDGNPGWLAIFGIFAWLAAALPLPGELFGLSLAVFAVILIALGALVVQRSRRSCTPSSPQAGAETITHRTRRPRSATTLALTGLGLGLAGATSATFGWPLYGHASVVFALLALALAVTPRVFRSAAFVAAATVCGAISLLIAVPFAEQATALTLYGIGLVALALAINRFPILAGYLFDLEAANGSRAALAYPAILSTLGAVALCLGDPYFARTPSALPLSWSIAGLATVSLLGFVAERQTMLLRLFVLAFVAAFTTVDKSELAFVLCNAALNAVLLLAGGLSTEAGRRIGGQVLHFFVPPDSASDLPENTVPALVGTSCAFAYVGVLALVVMSIARGITFGWGITSGLLLSPAWAPWICLAQLVTACHQLRRRARLDSWHALLIAILATLWLLGGPELWPYLAGSAAILFALLAGGATTGRGRRLLGFALPEIDDDDLESLASTLIGYSTTAAVLGCAITGLDLDHVATPISFVLAAAAMGVQAAVGSRVGKTCFLLAVPIAVHVAFFHLGIRLATGRPKEAILLALAAAMGLVTLCAQRLGTWRKARNKQNGSTALIASYIYSAVAAIEWGCGLGLVHFNNADLALSFVAGATLTLAWALRANASGSSIPAWLSQLAFLTLYFSVRLQTDWLGPRAERSEQDAIGVLVLSFLFLGLHAAVKRAGLEAFKTPTRFAALVLPGLSALLLGHQASHFNAAMIFGVAVAFTGLSALEGRGKLAGALAAVAYNFAITVLWLQQGIGGAGGIQYYVIPAGLTLIAAAWVWKHELGPAWNARLRSIGSLCIYAAAAWPALASIEQTVYLLWCIGLCVGGAIAGVLLRVRAYLYIGTACFVITLVGNAARYGIHHAILRAAFLTLIGLLLLGGLVLFSIKREHLLARYRKYRALLAEWD
jgi:hypothetical protein